MTARTSRATSGNDVAEVPNLEAEESSAESWVLLEQRVMESLFYLGMISFMFSFLMYWLVLERHLTWLDALYFTMATYTTISKFRA